MNERYNIHTVRVIFTYIRANELNAVTAITCESDLRHFRRTTIVTGWGGVGAVSTAYSSFVPCLRILVKVM